MSSEPTAAVPPVQENGSQSTPPGQRAPLPNEVITMGAPPTASAAEEPSSSGRTADQDRSSREQLDPSMPRAELSEVLTRALLDVATATLRAAALNVTNSRDGVASTRSVAAELHDAEPALELARAALAALTAPPQRVITDSEPPHRREPV